MNENPYPGLRPFRRDEAHLFFGRDEHTDHLLDKLAQARFISVIGLSGSGKSSLVRAGLLPNLEFGYLTEAGSDWGILTMRPGIAPILNLARATLDANLMPSLSGVEAGTQTLAQRLSSGGHLEFAQILQETLSPGQHRSFLLVVDQFEELFRNEDLSRPEERKFFVELLLTSARQKAVSLYVVMTIRSDWLGQCAQFRGLPEVINAGQFLVPRLTQEQMRQAITLPAQVVGGAIDARLTAQLLQDIEYNQDQLPILQHCLMQMWSEARKCSAGQPITLTSRDYEKIGSLQKALSNHADEAYLELTPERRAIAEVMFRRLTKGEFRRPAKICDIAAVAGVSDDEVNAVAAIFRDEERCFLHPTGDNSLHPETVLDISHECLIRNWQRLNDWVETETQSVEAYGRLEKTARLWKQGKAALWGTPDLEVMLDWWVHEQPTKEWAEQYGGHFELAQTFLNASQQAKEQKRQKELESERQLAKAAEKALAARRLGRLAAGLAMAVVVALAMAWSAWNNQQKAVTAKTEAEHQALIASTRYLAVQSQAIVEDTPQRSILLALEAMHSTTPPLPEAQEAVYTVVAKEGGIAHGRLAGDDKVLFSSDGRWLLTWNPERGRWWDLASSDLDPQEFPMPPKHIIRMAIRPDIPRLLGCSEDGIVYAWKDFNSAPDNGPFEWMRLSSAITAMSVSADGRWLVIGSADQRLHVWDFQSAAQEATLRILNKQAGKIQDLYFSPDSRWVMIRSEQFINLWDLQNIDNDFRPLTLPKLEGKAPSFMFGNDSRWLAIVDNHDLNVHVWNLDTFTSEILPPVPDSPQSLDNLVISPDNRWLVVNTENTTWLRNFKSQAAITGWIPLTRYADKFMLLTDASADGHWLLSRTIRASEDATPLLWDLTLENPAATPISIRGHDRQIMKTFFSPDHHWLITLDIEWNMRLWDLSTPRFDPGIQKFVSNHAPGSTGKQWAAVLDKAGAVHLGTLSDTGKLQNIAILSKPDETISDIVLSANGNRLASLSTTGRVCFWNLQHDVPPESCIPIKSSGITAITLSHDGDRLATGHGADNRIRIWNLEQEDKALSSPTHTLAGNSGSISKIFISQDDHWLVSSDNFTLQLWNLDARPEPVLLELTGYTGLLETLIISPDSQWLAASGRNTKVYVWKLSGKPSKKPWRTLTGHTGTIRDFAFSSDSHWLATGSDDWTVRLWNITSDEAKTLHGHTSAIWQVDFSPDAQWLISAGRTDNTARLWDWTAEQPDSTDIALRGYPAAVVGVAFSSDHRHVLTGRENGTIRSWLLDVEQLREYACQIAGRNFSQEEWKYYFPDTPWKDYQARKGTCSNFPLK